jgi:hypothetical protein
MENTRSFISVIEDDSGSRFSYYPHEDQLNKGYP